MQLSYQVSLRKKSGIQALAPGRSSNLHRRSLRLPWGRRSPISVAVWNLARDKDRRTLAR